VDRHAGLDRFYAVGSAAVLEIETEPAKCPEMRRDLIDPTEPCGTAVDVVHTVLHRIISLDCDRFVVRGIREDLPDLEIYGLQKSDRRSDAPYIVHLYTTAPDLVGDLMFPPISWAEDQ